MPISFRKAALPRERDLLARFDRRIFGSDAFDAEEWERLEAYWMIVDGKRIGCCAFERNAGSLYVVSTGIVRGFRRRGFGERFKRWQIRWARRHGFRRIITNSRRSNRAMISLNRKLGFRVIGTTSRSYYSDPPEPAVFMELKIPCA